jgi:hypothetical protein
MLLCAVQQSLQKHLHFAVRAFSTRILGDSRVIYISTASRVSLPTLSCASPSALTLSHADLALATSPSSAFEHHQHLPLRRPHSPPWGIAPLFRLLSDRG